MDSSARRPNHTEFEKATESEQTMARLELSGRRPKSLRKTSEERPGGVRGASGRRPRGVRGVSGSCPQGVQSVFQRPS